MLNDPLEDLPPSPRSHQISWKRRVPRAIADLRIAMPCAQPRLQFERVLIAAHAQPRFDPNLPFAPSDGVSALYFRYGTDRVFVSDIYDDDPLDDTVRPILSISCAPSSFVVTNSGVAVSTGGKADNRASAGFGWRTGNDRHPS